MSAQASYGGSKTGSASMDKTTCFKGDIVRVKLEARNVILISEFE